jgi:hypothetical protein
MQAADSVARRSSWEPRFADAYAAWAEANRRCAEALRAWQAAAGPERAAAYDTYLVRLDNEEAAAERLAELHSWYAEALGEDGP